MGLHQTKKKFAQQKKPSTKWKQPTEWENIVTNISDKGLVSKIYKELTKLNIKNQTIQLKNGQRTWIDTSTKRTCRWPIDIRKEGCSTSLIIREMQIKTTMSPGWYGSADWVPACKLRGCCFNSQSGHMPWLQARFPVGLCEKQPHIHVSLILSPSLPLCLKLNK